MKKTNTLTILIALTINIPLLNATSAVTYTLSWGRFGDHLVSYCHAKWIAFKYNIPLLVKPFKYYDQLALHDLEKHYCESAARKFKKTITLDNGSLSSIDRNADILYVVPYFPESNFDSYNHNNDFNCHFSVEWQDPAFKNELKKQIAPRHAISRPQLPENSICIAVHVRKGTGYDDVSILNEAMPLKFPPDSYYIDQIQAIINQFSGKRIYIYIFTDHDNPHEIMTRYATSISDHGTNNVVIFDCRKSDNHHTKNVIEDFFALTHYAYLIRADSNFSIIAAKLTEYTLEICPADFNKKDNIISINKVMYLGKK